MHRYQVRTLHSGLRLQSGAAGCVKGFVAYFLKFPLLAWAAWQLQFSPAARGTRRKHVTKPFTQPAVQDCRFHWLPFASSASLPICPAISAQFSPAQVELCRQRNKPNQKSIKLLSNHHGPDPEMSKKVMSIIQVKQVVMGIATNNKTPKTKQIVESYSR